MVVPVEATVKPKKDRIPGSDEFTPLGSLRTSCFDRGQPRHSQHLSLLGILAVSLIYA